MPAIAQQYHQHQTHYLRKDIAFNTAASGTALSMGAIPAGAMVLATTVGIRVAFNAATTNVLIVGTSGDDDALVAEGGVDETAVAVTRVVPATLAGLLSASADTEIFVKYTQSGTAASTGSAVVVVEYVLPTDTLS